MGSQQEQSNLKQIENEKMGKKMDNKRDINNKNKKSIVPEYGNDTDTQQISKHDQNISQQKEEVSNVEQEIDESHVMNKTMTTEESIKAIEKEKEQPQKVSQPEGNILQQKKEMGVKDLNAQDPEKIKKHVIGEQNIESLPIQKTAICSESMSEEFTVVEEFVQSEEIALMRDRKPSLKTVKEVEINQIPLTTEDIIVDKKQKSNTEQCDMDNAIMYDKESNI